MRALREKYMSVWRPERNRDPSDSNDGDVDTRRELGMLSEYGCSLLWIVYCVVAVGQVRLIRKLLEDWEERM